MWMHYSVYVSNMIAKDMRSAIDDDSQHKLRVKGCSSVIDVLKAVFSLD